MVGQRLKGDLNKIEETAHKLEEHVLKRKPPKTTSVTHQVLFFLFFFFSRIVIYNILLTRDNLKMRNKVLQPTKYVLFFICMKRL